MNPFLWTVSGFLVVVSICLVALVFYGIREAEWHKHSVKLPVVKEEISAAYRALELLKIRQKDAQDDINAQRSEYEDALSKNAAVKVLATVLSNPSALAKLTAKEADTIT